MAKEHIGTCGKCGGRVMKEFGPLMIHPDHWPSPSCESCGAKSKTLADRIVLDMK